MSGQVPSMDAFDAYFRRADLDMDGRISGAEAVAFFQGSNLPKQILAQIWMYCDTNKTGFLGRKEFYNALRLVTVSQRGKELTPEIVKAALDGPVSMNIPAPQINTSSIPTNPGNQYPGLRGPPLPSNATMGQQFFPSGGQHMMPRQPPPAMASRPLVGQSLLPPARPVSNMPNMLGGAFLGGSLPAPQFSSTSAVPRAVAPYANTASVPSNQPPAKDSKATITSGNGFNSFFGDNAFSAVSQPKKDVVGNAPSTAVMGALSSGVQTTLRPVQNVQMQSGLIPPQNETAQSTSANAGSSSVSSGRPWPRFSQSDVQKYSKVFMEVDTDKDGKITGEQAYNLFLSWKLPRDVLKQVWDLSDQDNDSALSHREFVIALYLMERHREGYPLPAMLPNSVKFDETLLQATSTSPAWQPNSGLPYQMMPGIRPMLAAPGVISQARNLVPQQIDAGLQIGQKQPSAHLRKEDKNALNLSFEEENDPKEKGPEPEKEILDYKEKIEFYRGKMQELVLYKSKCDNSLNEITEKALADKREVEFLGKKYDEKYKQVGELASKLAVEEAAFRDTQQRKSELHHAIVTVEKGGSADGLLQVRADRIHADLEGLLKALIERCKKNGVDIKTTAILELPFGWESGVQEGAAEWDEDWDKFEDEGFILSKEQDKFISLPKDKTSSAWTEKGSTDEISSVASPKDADVEYGKHGYAQSENGSTGYPSGGQYPEFSSPRFGVLDASPRAGDSPSARSVTSAGNFADDASWGAAFDAGDDGDSMSEFNAKGSYGESRRDSFFGPGELGLNPIRTGSPAASEFAGREQSPFFADSVPSTPQFSETSSPHFNNSFDSFSTTSSGLFPSREAFARFDSVRSTSDQSQRFGFEDPDPFGYSAPFKVQESSSSKQDSSKWSAF